MCQVCIRCSLFQNPTVRHHSGTEGNNWGLNSLVQVWARGKLPFGCAGTTAISAAARPLLWLGVAYCTPKIQRLRWKKTIPRQQKYNQLHISCVMYHHCYVMCVSISNEKGWNHLGYIWLQGLRVEDEDKQWQIQEIASFHSFYQRLNAKWSFMANSSCCRSNLRLECQSVPFKELKTYNTNGPKMSKDVQSQVRSRFSFRCHADKLLQSKLHNPKTYTLPTQRAQDHTKGYNSLTEMDLKKQLSIHTDQL